MDIDYAQYDLNEAQIFVFKLLMKVKVKDVDVLVRMLLDNRYTWFAVSHMHNQNYLSPSELVDGAFYADGIVIYTDVGGEKFLVPKLKKLEGFETNFITMRPADTVIDEEAPFPNEATAFINVTWETPEDIEDKFAKNIK